MTIQKPYIDGQCNDQMTYETKGQTKIYETQHKKNYQLSNVNPTKDHEWVFRIGKFLFQ